MSESQIKIDFEEKLINEVSVYPHLYDKKYKDYSNTNKRNITWADISNLLECTVLESKTKWKNLIDTFFHNIRAEKNTPSGSAAKEGKQIKWVHHNALQFLLPCLDTPSTLSNYTTETNINVEKETPVKISAKRKKSENDEVGRQILQVIENVDMEKTPSESKLFLGSLVPRFERLTNVNRSCMQFKILELLHEIEFNIAIDNNSLIEEDNTGAIDNSTDLNQHNLYY